MHAYFFKTADNIWFCYSNNYRKLETAFKAFGMPMFDMTLNNFLDTERFDVFRFGRKPVAIDVMTKVRA